MPLPDFIVSLIPTTPYESMRCYTMFIMCLTVFFLFADQNLLAPNLSQVADDFHMSESEKDEKLGGYIAFGFFIVGGPAALCVGYLTDSINRCYLFGLVVAFGETACLATYWVTDFEQLLLCRVLTGVSIGGAIPLIFSMLGDLYPESARTNVSTLVGIAFSAGVAGGQFLAGMVGPPLGWRAPFLIVAIPALGCAALMAFTVEEPKRGDQEAAVRAIKAQRKRAANTMLGQLEDPPSDEHCGEVSPTGSTTTTSSDDLMINGKEKESSNDTGTPNAVADAKPATNMTHGYSEEVLYSETVDWEKLKILLNTRTVLLSYFQGIPGCVPWGMIYVFLNDYFSDDRGLSVQKATITLTCFGLGVLAGQFHGGYWGQILYNKDPRYQCILMGGSTLVGILPMLYLLNTTDYNPGGFYFMAIVAGYLVSITGPNVRAILQNVTAPEVRGSAFAVFALTDDLGKGLGPGLVYLFIQAFDGDRRAAYNVIVLFWIICGCLLLTMAFTVKDDEAQVKNQVKSVLMNQAATADDMNAAVEAGAAAAAAIAAAESGDAVRNIDSSEVAVELTNMSSQPDDEVVGSSHTDSFNPMLERVTANNTDSVIDVNDRDGGANIL